MTSRIAGRRPTSERATPHLDVWIEELAGHLEGDGRAALVDYLSGGDATLRPRWQTWLWKLLRREIVPNGEDVLAVSAWIVGRRATNVPKAAKKMAVRQMDGKTVRRQKEGR
ncbi:MAG: hypothetical protein QOE70_2103 [Chthoniobacter sp.]|jgi:hypothetical protein|nr:hypothetical protein [Chthoniobacter sp.]